MTQADIYVGILRGLCVRLLFLNGFVVCMFVGDAAERPHCNSGDLSPLADGLFERQRSWIQIGLAGKSMTSAIYCSFVLVFSAVTQTRASEILPNY